MAATRAGAGGAGAGSDSVALDADVLHRAMGGDRPIASPGGTRGAAHSAALALNPRMLSMDTTMSPIRTGTRGGRRRRRRRHGTTSPGGRSVKSSRSARSAPMASYSHDYGTSTRPRTSRTEASRRTRNRLVWEREHRENGRDLLSSMDRGNVDFEKAEHLDWSVRVRENLGSMGYGPRFRQDRGKGYASVYLLDKPLNSVGPQVRSDWVSPGSIDFGTCTRANKQKQFEKDYNPSVGPGAYKAEPSALGPQPVSTHRTMPSAIFSEAAIEGENYKGRSPGPKYLLPATVGGKHSKKCSFGAAPKVAKPDASRSPGPKYLLTSEVLKHVTGQGSSTRFSFGVAKRKTMVFPQFSPGPVYNIKDPWKKKRRNQKGFSFGAAKRPPLTATMGMKMKF